MSVVCIVGLQADGETTSVRTVGSKVLSEQYWVVLNEYDLSTSPFKISSNYRDSSGLVFIDPFRCGFVCSPLF